jgi:RHS repeat-associated protein
VLLDEQFKIVNTSTGFEPVGSDGEFKTFVKTGLPISQNGYLYLYTSNESPVDVFFDNLQVTHVRGPLLEESHYYPFGLTMAGISSKSAGKLENRFKYNEGTERTTDLDLNWDETYFRSYDPQIGRFHQQDPLADAIEDLSPFSFANNNPVRFNDPLGLVGDDLIPAPDPTTLPEVVVYSTKPGKKQPVAPAPPPQSTGAGVTPLPLVPMNPLTPVPPSAPVIPMNPIVNPAPEIGVAGVLGRLIGVIGGVLYPTDAGRGSYRPAPTPYFVPYPGHGNNKDNSNPHIVYQFTYTPLGAKSPVLKYGISDEHRNGLNRPESQIAGLKARYGASVAYKILTRTLNRQQALAIEQNLVNLHNKTFGQPPIEQQRPTPF